MDFLNIQRMIRELLNQRYQVRQSFTRTCFRFQNNISIRNYLRDCVSLDVCQFLKATFLEDLLQLIIDFQILKLVNSEVNCERFGWFDFRGFFLDLSRLFLVFRFLNFFSRFFKR